MWKGLALAEATRAKVQQNVSSAGAEGVGRFLLVRQTQLQCISR